MDMDFLPVNVVFVIAAVNSAPPQTFQSDQAHQHQLPEYQNPWKSEARRLIAMLHGTYHRAPAIAATFEKKKRNLQAARIAAARSVEERKAAVRTWSPKTV
ncbi:uncharacterized protein LOC144106757 [Amblyomma americanum]